MSKKLLSLILAIGIVFSSFTSTIVAIATDVTPVTVAEPVPIVTDDVMDIALPSHASGGNILHAWNMSFEEIIRQLPYIAAAGFNTIQTSPIGDSIFQFPYYDGGRPTSPDIRSRVGTWWMLYQPRSFEIGNMLGTEAQFRALTAAAAEYGIGIIVDAVPNHTTSWWHEIDDSLRRPELFHSVPGDGTQWDRNISNWGSREESRRARLLGLVTFDTTNHEFQDMYMEFLGRKIDAGAIGFRYDAMVHIELPYPHDAAHIASDFWPNIQNFVDERVTATGNTPFQYGEILHRWHADYLRALPGMQVTACGYGYHIRNNVINGNLGNWNTTNFHVGGYAGATADRFVTWVESHDTYGNAGGSRGITDNQMRVGWAIMTARQGTTPLFLVRPGAGFMNDGQMFFPNGDGSYRNIWGHSEFYRDTTITEVNWFANRFINEPERTSTHFNQVALIERGPAGAKEGVVIVNSGNLSRAVDFPVDMVDGEYIDQVTGQVFTVANGRITGPAIFGQSVAVIHGQTPRDTTPNVSATPGSSNFLDPAGVVVTLSASHTTIQTYTITLADDVIVPMTPFVHGEEIIVGDGAVPGDEFILTLTGSNGEEVVTETFVYTKGDPNLGIRIEFAHDAWDQVHIWGWHPGGGNIFAMGWGDAPLMTWEDDVEAWVYTINPFTHPQFNIDQPFNVMFHNGDGSQLPTGAPYWLIRGNTRIEIVNGLPVFIDLTEDPQVFATPGSQNFYTDEGITVTLSARHTTAQTFMLTDASGLITINATPFVDGETITIGSNAFVGDEFTLILEGTNGSRVVRETFVYRREAENRVRIEFAYGENWSQARIWAFRNPGGNVFPGLAWGTAPLMTWEDDVNAWVFEFEPDHGTGFYVIFHNGAGTQRGVNCFVNESVRITMNGPNICEFGPLYTPTDPGGGDDDDDPGITDPGDDCDDENCECDDPGITDPGDDCDDANCDEEEPVVLSPPSELVITNGVLTWEVVEGAYSYRVYINDKKELVTTETELNLLVLNLAVGTHTIQVRALSADEDVLDSALSPLIEFTVVGNQTPPPPRPTPPSPPATPEEPETLEPDASIDTGEDDEVEVFVTPEQEETVYDDESSEVEEEILPQTSMTSVNAILLGGLVTGMGVLVKILKEKK